MPSLLLPDIILRAADEAPPIVTLEVPSSCIPSPVFPISTVPRALRPIMLPRIVDESEVGANITPCTPLPDITLPSPLLMPPIVIAGAELNVTIPSPALPRLESPAELIPM